MPSSVIHDSTNRSSICAPDQGPGRNEIDQTMSSSEPEIVYFVNLCSGWTWEVGGKEIDQTMSYSEPDIIYFSNGKTEQHFTTEPLDACLQFLTRAKSGRKSHRLAGKISQIPTAKLERPHPKPTNPCQMALRINFLAPKPLQLIPNFHISPFPVYSPSAHIIKPSPRYLIPISCASNNNNSFSDAELALNLAADAEKLKAQIAEEGKALNKSKELLFNELSNYLGLNAEEAKVKWKTLNEDDKMAVIRGFVSEWSYNFHPLSAKSAKELVDEYLADERKSSVDSSPPLFPFLRKLIGLLTKC